MRGEGLCDKTYYISKKKKKNIQNAVQGHKMKFKIYIM